MQKQRNFKYIIYLTWIALISDILNISAVSRFFDRYIGFPLFDDTLELVFVSIPAFCIFFYSKLLRDYRRKAEQEVALHNKLIETNHIAVESEKNLRAILENSDE